VVTELQCHMAGTLTLTFVNKFAGRCTVSRLEERTCFALKYFRQAARLGLLTLRALVHSTVCRDGRSGSKYAHDATSGYQYRRKLLLLLFNIIIYYETRTVVQISAHANVYLR